MSMLYPAQYKSPVSITVAYCGLECVRDLSMFFGLEVFEICERTKGKEIRIMCEKNVE